MRTKIIDTAFWVHYVGDIASTDRNTLGEWRYTYDTVDNISKFCEHVVDNEVVVAAKHGTTDYGVASFYVDNQDEKGHKAIIGELISKGMVPKDSNGIYEDLKYELYIPKRLLEKEGIKPFSLSLSDFIDLTSGEWVI